MGNEMTSKSLSKLLIFTITIWIVSVAVGCSTFTPISTRSVMTTETVTSTKTPFQSETITSTPEPSPTPYNGSNILFYVQDDNQLFSIHIDGGNPQEIAQGILFAISPDKKKIAFRTAETYASDQDEMVVFDIEQEKVIFRWHIPGYCEGVFMSSRLAWSPDSQRIAFILVRYDLVDPDPSCELEYNYEDMGIYQIDLTSTKITHPPIDAYDYSLSASILLSYSPNSSRLRIGARGQVFDAETWEQIVSEPYYDLQQLGSQPEKIGICGDFNLCLYDRNNQIVKPITRHDKSWEGAETFKLFPNSSAVVYQTQEHQLHLLSLSGGSDEMIGTNIWEYFVTPDNSRIVFYERDRFAEDANVFVANSDGLNKHSIAQFPQRHAPITGSLMILSPTGEKIAFVNRDGIAIMGLDGNNFAQLVNLPNDTPTDTISLEILDWY